MYLKAAARRALIRPGPEDAALIGSRGFTKLAFLVPNFHAFERLIRQSMVVDADAISRVLTEMASILDSQRPTLFRRLRRTALRRWVTRARRFLRDRYGRDAVFRTTENNLLGSDLEVTATGEMVELKSGGPVTDANAGVSSIAWTLGDSSAELKEIMSFSMNERRGAYLDGDRDKVDRSKRDTMERLFFYFQHHLVVGDIAPPRLQFYVRCIARGITKAAEIRRLYEHEDLSGNAPQILHADLDRGWRPEEHAFDRHEAIVVDEIIMSAPSSQSDVPRLTVILRGSVSGRKARLYPHYKNSYKLKNGDKIPAEYWVRTACFHVWIGREAR